MIDDDTVEFGEEHTPGNKLPHPYVTLCHFAFRVGAILVYFFGGLFSDGFISLFVTIILLLSCDFWTVKNITGRIMVGLRWWNYIDENGESHWVFESRKGNSQNRINATEAYLFWCGLIAVSFIWSFLFVIALLGFKFRWLLLVCIALSLNYANLYGYAKCRFGQHSDNSTLGSTISAYTTDFIKKSVLTSILNAKSPPSSNDPNASMV